QARLHCAQARAVYEETATRFPHSCEFLRPNICAIYEFAWFLLTSPVESERDPGRAVGLVEKSLGWGEFYPGVRAIGVARLRMGDNRAALNELNRAIVLGYVIPDPEVLLFRAIAHCRLGDRGAARKDYDEALRLMAWRHDNWPELEGFQAEAAAVLGV